MSRPVRVTFVFWTVITCMVNKGLIVAPSHEVVHERTPIVALVRVHTRCLSRLGTVQASARVRGLILVVLSCVLSSQ